LRSTNRLIKKSIPKRIIASCKNLSENIPIDKEENGQGMDMIVRKQIGSVMAQKDQREMKKEKMRILDEFVGITKYCRGYGSVQFLL